MLKLEFLNGCGVHIGAVLSGSGVYYEFHVGCKQTLKKPLSVFLTKAIICLLSLVLGLSIV